MKNVITIIFIVLVQSAFAQSAWEKVEMDLDKPFKNIFFINEIIGWGFSSVYNSSTWNYDNEFHRTSNGGLTWTSVSFAEGVLYFEFNFVSQDVGWGIGNGEIFKTNNSGYNWDVKYLGNKSFKKIFCLTDQICWVLCDEKVLLKTTNGGESWEEMEINVDSRDVVDLCFIDENTGFCCYQGIYKTTDGGKTWVKKLAQGYYTDYHCIQFVNDSTGWAAGQAIHKTVDGGETWQLQKRIADYASWGPDAGSCYFVNENKGWVGLDLFTTDGGNTWQEYDPVVVEYLGAFCFISNDIGYALNSGQLYKTTTGGFSTSIEDNKESATPANFKLFQNYPNPFNPKTTICYSLPQAGQVTLEIYNLLGQKIETLVNEYKTAGEYQIQWQPKDLPSGIYLVQIYACLYHKIIKLILQK